MPPNASDRQGIQRGNLGPMSMQIQTAVGNVTPLILRNLSGGN